MQHASSIGINPETILDSGATSVRSLGLSASQLKVVLECYGTGIEHAMYLGIAVAGGMLLFAWGLGFENILEIKKLKEITDDSSKEKESESAPEELTREKGTV